MSVAVTKPKIEEEQAMIVRSDNPLETFASLSSLITLGGCKVGEPEPHVIVDRFFDTEDCAIKSTKSSLRIRELDGVPYVTLKGKNVNAGFIGDSSQKRTELEFEWPYTEPSAYDLVALFGLVEKQKRTTQRIQKEITRKTWKDNVAIKTLIAELALDTVTYEYVGQPSATLYEVEIEMKETSTVKLSDLVKPLLKGYPELELWAHSKYSTGKILEYCLQVKLDESGVVNDRAFDIVSYFLNK